MQTKENINMPDSWMKLYKRVKVVEGWSTDWGLHTNTNLPSKAGMKFILWMWSSIFDLGGGEYESYVVNKTTKIGQVKYE